MTRSTIPAIIETAQRLEANPSGTMKERIKRHVKEAQNYANALHRGPALAALAFRHIVAPAALRYAQSVHKVGFREAHWETIGKGLVRFFQESGPVLTKVGQILATRSDILSPTLISHLEALYNQQPPMSRKQLNWTLHSIYGSGSPFAQFDAIPFAVGSVGQIHRASLLDGSPVIVKIIRPGSHCKIKQDTAALTAIVKTLFCVTGQQKSPSYRMIRRTLEDLEYGFLGELNLNGEAKALEKFRKRLRRNSQVYIPKVYLELSSSRALVIEEIKGESLAKFRKHAKTTDGQKTKLFAELALREILTQIFDHGNFHADPHAGNFIVMEDGRLGLIDFGLTGEFSKKDRKRISKAVRAFMSRDADAVITSLLEFGTRPEDFNFEKFKNDVVEQVNSKRSSGFNIDEMVNDLFKVSYSHHIYVPQSTTLLIKTLVTVEGVARALDPEIKLASVALPVILRSLTPKWIRLATSVILPGP